MLSNYILKTFYDIDINQALWLKMLRWTRLLVIIDLHNNIIIIWSKYAAVFLYENHHEFYVRCICLNGWRKLYYFLVFKRLGKIQFLDSPPKMTKNISLFRIINDIRVQNHCTFLKYSYLIHYNFGTLIIINNVYFEW